MSDTEIISRIKQCVELDGSTINSFANQIGVDPGNLRKMLGGKQKITDKTLRKISESRNVSFEWLKTGLGEMMKDSEPMDGSESKTGFKPERTVMVPLINIDSVGGVHSQNMLTAGEQYVEGMVPFPDARPDDVAILQSGNSMAPTIPAGAILQIRKVNGWQEYFGYGSDFVLWLTDDRRITKQVLKFEPDPKHYVVCHSYNPEAADEELPRSMIREVWKVVNVLINKGW